MPATSLPALSFQHSNLLHFIHSTIIFLSIYFISSPVRPWELVMNKHRHRAYGVEGRPAICKQTSKYQTANWAKKWEGRVQGLWEACLEV